VQQAPKHSVHAAAPDIEPRQDTPAQPRYFEDASGHRSILERLAGHQIHTTDGTALERRWPVGTAILFIAGASAASWAGIAGVVWAVAG